MNSGAELGSSANRTIAGSGMCLVRPAQIDDVVAIVTLCGEHAQFEHVVYDRTDKATRLHEALFAPMPKLCAWVAVVDGDVVGYATASGQYSTWDAAEHLHMDCLYLRQEHRNSGIGPAMVSLVVEQARELGYREVQWQTPAWNADACRFYRRFGGSGQQKVRFRFVVADG